MCDVWLIGWFRIRLVCVATRTTASGNRTCRGGVRRVQDVVCAPLERGRGRRPSTCNAQSEPTVALQIGAHRCAASPRLLYLRALWHAQSLRGMAVGRARWTVQEPAPSVLSCAWGSLTRSRDCLRAVARVCVGCRSCSGNRPRLRRGSRASAVASRAGLHILVIRQKGQTAWASGC